MDLRQYTVADTNELAPLGADANAGESAKRYIRLEPKAPDADVQAMVDESAAGFSAMSPRMAAKERRHR